MATAANKPGIESETRIPFGAGYDAPTHVERGTVVQRFEAIKEAFGLEKTNAKTLVELTVEAALVAHGLVNASTLGPQPAQPAQNAIPEQKKADEKAKPAARQGIAGKRTTRKSIEKQVAEAKTEDELAGVYRANKDKITDDQLKLFSERKAEIQKGNS